MNFLITLKSFTFSSSKSSNITLLAQCLYFLSNLYISILVCSFSISENEILIESSVFIESKILKGLYCAGEILDVVGDCGGFNLQWAWSSAYVCSRECVNSMLRKVY